MKLYTREFALYMIAVSFAAAGAPSARGEKSTYELHDQITSHICAA